jgi:ORF6N domain-containing protein
MSELVQVVNIERRIYTIRSVQVMLDRDLAELYEVETRALKQAVKRNPARFPSDFMFELTENEVDSLVSQSVIPSKKQLGGAKPFVFTEQGVSSLSAVLTSKRAVEINKTSLNIPLGQEFWVFSVPVRWILKYEE